jgi:hypothetical protein
MDHEAAPPADGVIAYSEREAWEFVHFLSGHLASLETRAAIIMPAQVAALIAIWTQLYTFEETFPRTLVWLAWAAFILGLVGAAWLITPGRAQRASIVERGLHEHVAHREEIVRELCTSLQERVRVLHAGLRISVGLTVLALALVVVAYALDKGIFNG